MMARNKPNPSDFILPSVVPPSPHTPSTDRDRLQEDRPSTTTTTTSLTRTNNALSPTSHLHNLSDLDTQSSNLDLPHTSTSTSPRRSSRDSDITLIASPIRPSSRSSSRTTPMSEHLSFPPRSDSLKHAALEQRRPLVDYVTNEWQNKPSYRDSSFESNDSYSNFYNEKEGFSPPIKLPEWVRRIQVPRRVQRYLGGYILFLLVLWFGWLYWLQPSWAHEKLLDQSAATALKKGSSFGVNMRPTFDGMIHLQDLDSGLLPTGNRRLVFVGDVHGCKDELQKLLNKIKFNQDSDHLILTGDLIAKGPDSRGAVDLAMQVGASCVRGNWEDRTLLAYNSLTAKVHPLPGPQEDPQTREDYLDEESFSHGDYKDRALAKLLSKDQVKWLKKCPVLLRVGVVEGFNGGSEIVVAHAGLVPGVALDRQDPFQCMNMRSIDLTTRVPSEDRKGEPWEKLWNHHQSHLPKLSERTTVIYGHDSKRGLNIEKYSKGLDSGCLKGGSLTALTIDSRGRTKVVSVDCKRRIVGGEMRKIPLPHEFLARVGFGTEHEGITYLYDGIGIVAWDGVATYVRLLGEFPDKDQEFGIPVV